MYGSPCSLFQDHIFGSAKLDGWKVVETFFFLGDSAIEINIFCLNYVYQIGSTKLRTTSVAAYQKSSSISNEKF